MGADYPILRDFGIALAASSIVSIFIYASLGIFMLIYSFFAGVEILLLGKLLGRRITGKLLVPFLAFNIVFGLLTIDIIWLMVINNL